MFNVDYCLGIFDKTGKIVELFCKNAKCQLSILFKKPSNQVFMNTFFCVLQY